MKKIYVLMCVVVSMVLFVGCNEKKKAQEPVDAFMQGFCTMDFQMMVGATDSDADVTQMTYMSLNEMRADYLGKFEILKLVGLPIESLEDIINNIFDTYEQKASYSIKKVETRENEYVFHVEAQYVRPIVLVNLLDEAINRINIEELKAEATMVLVGNVLMGKSIKELLNNLVATAATEVELALDRLVKEIEPETGTFAFAVYQNGENWVISEERSQLDPLETFFAYE